MIDIPQLVELYGLPGLVIGGLGWAYLAERRERRETQDRERAAFERTLTTLKDLTDAIRNGGV